MKRRMFWSQCALAAGMALLACLLSLWTAYGLLLAQAKNDLAGQLGLIARTLDLAGGGAGAYLDALGAQPGLRVTRIAPDGTVLYDSDADRAGMEPHGDRPEVRAAFETGHGEDVRRSGTVGVDSYYYAEKQPDGTVLRVSGATRNIGAVLSGAAPVMLGVAALVLLLSMGMASRLTRRLLAPIERLAERIDAPSPPDGYEELEPLAAKIRAQNLLIREQMERLRAERDTIRLITGNMREGLILLDPGQNVLSVNPSALALLGARPGDYEGKSFLYLSRAQELADRIGEATARGQAGGLLLERDGRFCRASVSPVRRGEETCGAIVLLQDVTEQQQAERIRRDFTANVSHELKTPLTSISGFAEMIESGMARNDADVKRFAGRICREASRLVALTDDIIRLSRIEQEGLPDPEPVELRALCDGVAATLSLPAAKKGVTLNVTGGPLAVWGDARMLEELVQNLCDNAVKYNCTGGRVDVSLRREGGDAVIVVADTGIGIPREHQGRIFERFYRVDKSRSKQTGGTGLGLSIVKHIVERHGGAIRLESAEGAGTTVTVQLPGARSSGARTRPS